MFNLFNVSNLFAETEAIVEKSPFTDVNYESEPSVTVEYEGETYFLLTVNDMPRTEIMTQCANVFGADCKTKFALNFLETMAAVGMPVTGDTVKLGLYKFATHTPSVVEAAKLTEANVEDIRFNRELRGED